MPPTAGGSSRRPRLAILGAGPIGLEAALAAVDAGMPFTLYDTGLEPAANVRAWGHVRLFTPWRMNVSPRMRRHLEAAGEAPPGNHEDGACPTGSELAERLYDRVAALPQVAPRLRLGTRVMAVGREGLLKHEEIATAERGRRPFLLLLAERDGGERVEHAEVVIDATGTFGQPNSLGDGGIPAPGELQLGAEIRRAIPDLARDAADWAGRTVLLAGAGASAQTAVRGLAELARSAPGTRVIWALRRAEPAWGSPPDDPLPERARLAAAAAELAAGASPAVTVQRGVVVEAVAHAAAGDARDARMMVTLGRAGGSGLDGDGAWQVTVDRVLSLTGAVGDHQIYRQLQVHECYATCGPIKLSAALLGAGAGDCLEQASHGVEALTNPEPGFFILGSKSYGRNNSFLLRVGWDQVTEVFAALRSPG
ncbi:MAG TPA: flavoprotein [Thermoanaerobaculia bacterium]|nr:flavoprotein [Thermoanaerobaculia bacterium]